MDEAFFKFNNQLYFEGGGGGGGGGEWGEGKVMVILKTNLR